MMAAHTWRAPTRMRKVQRGCSCTTWRSGVRGGGGRGRGRHLLRTSLVVVVFGLRVARAAMVVVVAMAMGVGGQHISWMVRLALPALPRPFHEARAGQGLRGGFGEKGRQVSGADRNRASPSATAERASGQHVAITVINVEGAATASTESDRHWHGVSRAHKQSSDVGKVYRTYNEARLVVGGGGCMLHAGKGSRVLSATAQLRGECARRATTHCLQ